MGLCVCAYVSTGTRGNQTGVSSPRDGVAGVCGLSHSYRCSELNLVRYCEEQGVLSPTDSSLQDLYILNYWQTIPFLKEHGNIN